MEEWRGKLTKFQLLSVGSCSPHLPSPSIKAALMLQAYNVNLCRFSLVNTSPQVVLSNHVSSAMPYPASPHSRIVLQPNKQA